MTFPSSFFNILFNILFYPFEQIHPIYGLLAISTLTGLMMLAIFRFTSKQEEIERVKDKIKAHFMEVVLFKDSLGMVFRAQKDILKWNLFYLRYFLIPLLIMIFPVIIILVQIGYRYEHRPLLPGESAIVALRLNYLRLNEEDFFPNSKEVFISVPDGLKIETPALRIASEGEINWRIGAEREGIYDLVFNISGERVIKKLVVSNTLTKLSTKRSQHSIFDIILNADELSFSKNSLVNSIEVKYPHVTLKIFGWNIHWLIIFFVVSILSGFMLKGVLKVNI